MLEYLLIVWSLFSYGLLMFLAGVKFEKIDRVAFGEDDDQE